MIGHAGASHSPLGARRLHRPTSRYLHITLRLAKLTTAKGSGPAEAALVLSLSVGWYTTLGLPLLPSMTLVLLSRPSACIRDSHLNAVVLDTSNRAMISLSVIPFDARTRGEILDMAASLIEELESSTDLNDSSSPYRDIWRRVNYCC